MLLSIGFVVSLFAWCIYKVATTPRKPESMHGFEFETPDEKQERSER